MLFFYLLELDQKMETLDVEYFRFMVHPLVLAPARWGSRKAIRFLNRTFNELNLEKHLDETLIGRVERGFDFLDYHLKSYSLDVSEKTTG